MKIFSQILEGKDFELEEILEINAKCVTEETGGKQLVQIECTKPLGATSSLAAQNSCNAADTCPTGFSKRNSKFCLPNRCLCDNGLAATSTYGSMRSICGVTQEDETGVGPNPENTGEAVKGRHNEK